MPIERPFRFIAEKYDPRVTTTKGFQSAGKVAGLGVLLLAPLYVLRANTTWALWPEEWDAPIVVAVVAALGGFIRAAVNRKHTNHMRR